MLNLRLIREKDARLHLEVMAYLIRQFGAPPRPPVPSPLRKTAGLESLAWDPSDTRSTFHWALDQFGELKSTCGMSDLDAELFPQGQDASQDAVLADHRLSTLAAGRIPYQKNGASSVTYNPWSCSEPGYFVATIALQLARFRLTDFKPDTPPTSTQQQQALLAAAAYNRLGFVLANLSEPVARSLTQKDGKRSLSDTHILNNLCFATCLALRVRRQSAEQIVATYGTRVTPAFRKKIPQACRQIDSHGDILELLHMLAEPQLQNRSDAPLTQNRA